MSLWGAVVRSTEMLQISVGILAVKTRNHLVSRGNSKTLPFP